MWYIIGVVAVGVICFLAGILVYRNNAKGWEKQAIDFQAKLNQVKTDLQAARDALTKK